MKKIILALATCGVITGSVMLCARPVAASWRDLGGGIAWRWEVNEFNAAHDKYDNDPEFQAMARNRDLYAAELAYARAAATNDIAKVLEHNRSGIYWTRDRDRWDRTTLDDTFLYWLNCTNCCVELKDDGDGCKKRRKAQSYSDRVQIVKDLFCSDTTRNIAMNNCQTLLDGMERIHNLPQAEQDDLLFARGYDLQVSADHVDNGAVVMETHAAKGENDRSIDASQSSATRYFSGKIQEALRDENSNVTKTLLRVSGARSTDELLEKRGGPFGVLTDIRSLSILHAETLMADQRRRNEDILRGIRERIEQEANARRRAQLQAVTNELEALQRSLSGAMNCRGDDCYKVYDVGDKVGKSVTNNQSMSDYIDIR